MPKWTLEGEPEMVPCPVDPNHYQQIIAEVSELLYDYFNQLDQRRKSQTDSIGADTPDQMKEASNG